MDREPSSPRHAAYIPADVQPSAVHDDRRWFVARVRRSKPRVRLFCLPYAGGHAAVYRSWAQRVPDSVELWPIELPGRWSRVDELPFTSMQQLVDTLGPVLARHLDLPYALLGYSFGAIATFELARWLRRAGMPAPERLIVLSSTAPHVSRPLSALHHLDDNELLARVGERYARLPPAVLDDAELRQIILRTLRADLRCFETYRYEHEAPLGHPIHAYGGQADIATPRAGLSAWQAQGAGQVTTSEFPGGHFFVENAADDFFRSLAALLTD